MAHEWGWELDGANVGGYRVGRRLTARGPIWVYHASGHGALVVFNPSPFPRDLTLARFDRVARISDQVPSPHCMRVFDTGFNPGRGLRFLLTELPSGKLVSKVVGARALDVGEATRLIEQVCHAIHAAHAVGLVHGELAPHHIFVERTDDGPLVKIIGFGLTRLYAEGARERGARDPHDLHWPSPEIWAGDDATPASDLWAIGLLAFMLITRHEFFVDEPRTPASRDAREEAITRAPIPRAWDRARAVGVHRREQCPKGFDDWFARCVTRDPSARFASARDAFDAWLRDVAVGVETGPRIAHKEPTDAQRDEVARALVPSERPPELEPGNRFLGDAYTVISTLRREDTTIAYLAHDHARGTLVILELLRSELRADASARAAFIEKWRLLAKVGRCKDVMEVFASGVEPSTDTPWAAAENSSGETLDARIARDPLGVEEASALVRMVCNGLSRLRAAGIAHTDLGPHAIFLRTKSKWFTPRAPLDAKLIGLGSVRAVPSETTPAQGRPLWMAPEQSKGGATVRASVDVWALGLVLFEALTAKHFWRGAEAEDDVPALLREILVEPIARPSDRARELGLEASLPRGFDAWFARCVNRDPERRFTAEEASEAWDAMLADPPPASESSPRVRRCVKFAFACPRRWTDLDATSDVDVKYCGDCARPVFLCASVEEANARGARGECVALPRTLADEPPPTEPEAREPTLVGKLMVDDSDSDGSAIEPSKAGLWQRVRGWFSGG